MPKEKISLFGLFSGDEPGLHIRFRHILSGNDEGAWGELCIAKLLKNRISGAAIFQNIYVPTDSGTTELDVVMADQSGIYVFESKAYGGKIYGAPENMNWSQYLGGKKYTFYNPVKQNENHCRYLSKALQIPRSCLMSFIVFENRSDLSKVLQPVGDSFIVCNRNHLLQALKKSISFRNTVFSIEELTTICDKLEQWNTTDAAVKKQHIQQVKNRMYGNVCPVCGRNLVERAGKYGTFIGCTGYPKCTYTRKLEL